jgi:hypothetical protein
VNRRDFNHPNLNEKKWAEYAIRGGNDVIAPVKVLRSMPKANRPA